MLTQKSSKCIRDDCGYPRYGLSRLCAGHHLEEHPGKPRKSKASTKPANDIPAAVRAFVLARSGGRCEACGRSLGSSVPHFHHRMRRRDGGHGPANIVVLHGECHVVAPQAVHQRPTWARERGLIVPSWADPADVPLLLPSPDGPDRRVRLDDTTPEYLDPHDGVLYAA